MFDDIESIRFRHFSTLDGHTLEIQIGYRNRRPIPILNPRGFYPPVVLQDQDSEELKELKDEICAHLNPREREVWLTVLDTNGSVSETAERLRVTRQAILFRIRGDKRTPGMIQKNDYVAIWWGLRNKKKRP